MGLAATIVLLLLAVLLFVAANKGWISAEFLQRLANVAGVIALFAAVVLFFISQQTQRQNISPDNSLNSQGDSVDSNITDRANENLLGTSVLPEENSEYYYLSEEQVRREISGFLETDNVDKAIRLLPYILSDTAKNEEYEHIFNYCIKNGKLEKAEEMIKFFQSPTKKEAALRELAIEKMKQ